jgi:hypothetical protein
MDWFDRKIVEYVAVWTPASLAGARSRMAAPGSMPMSVTNGRARATRCSWAPVPQPTSAITSPREGAICASSGGGRHRRLDLVERLPGPTLISRQLAGTRSAPADGHAINLLRKDSVKPTEAFGVAE